MTARPGMLTLALAALAASPGAWADHERGERGYTERDAYDYARVVDVEPIIRYVTVSVPREECYNDSVYHEPRRERGSHRAAGAMIAGGLIGGVVGRQFGGGRGRDAATLAGTLLGTAIAHDQATRRSGNYYGGRRHETVRRCSVSHDTYEEERIQGYRVTYEYNGQIYTTRMPRDPGREVKVRVQVSPVEDY